MGDAEFKAQGMTLPGNPESVASHMYGAYLLGLALLPPNPDPNPECYDRNEILHLLLVHDIDEAFTGDIPSPEKTERHRAEARKWVQYLKSASAVTGLQGLMGVVDAWTKTEDRQRINGRIAKELDKLDNLVQLYLYNKKFPGKIENFDKWKHETINMIETQIGRTIRNTIVRHFEQE